MTYSPDTAQLESGGGRSSVRCYWWPMRTMGDGVQSFLGGTWAVTTGYYPFSHVFGAVIDDFGDLVPVARR